MGLSDVVRNFVRRIRRQPLDSRWRHDSIQKHINVPSHDIYRAVFGRTGHHVADADWDTLLILDACRADAFETTVDLDQFDDYRREYSLGSTTVEWADQNFAGRELGDIVYVTSNPYVTVTVNDAFHDVVEVWRTHYDEELETVTPDTVAEVTRETRQRYPNKRIIAHFMQPHIPFIGDDSPQFDGWTPPHDGGRDAFSIFHALAAGTASVEAAWQAYVSNLRHVMDVVNRLLPELEGRTVVTSDHGNLFGERSSPVPIRGYGHITGLSHRKLREVPWAVVENGTRPEIVKGERQVIRTAKTEEVKERLRQLGYHE